MIGVKTMGFDAAINSLRRLDRQIKFATAKALTRTAKRVAQAEAEAITKSFDNPVPFTKRAIGFSAATIQKQESRVFVKDRQAKYLRAQIEGGSRDVKPFERRMPGVGYWVPGPGVKLNVAGNVPLATIKKLTAELQAAGKKSGTQVFVGKLPGRPNSPFAIWAKNGNTIKPMLIRVDSSPQYRRRFDFYGIANAKAGAILKEEMDRAVNEAIADMAGRGISRAAKGFF